MNIDQIFKDRQLKDTYSQHGWSWNYDLIDLAEMICDVKHIKSYLDYVQSTQ